MKKIVISVFLILLTSLTLGTSHAALVVDTGAGDPNSTTSLNNTFWWAAEFTLDADYTISDIEVYIKSTELNPGDTQLAAAIYYDGGDLPGTLFDRQTFLVPAPTTPPFARTFSWVGANGLTWDLTSGNYWVAFEVRSTTNPFSGVISTSAANPLANEAYAVSGTYYDGDAWDIAVRINETPQVIPIPSTLSLFSLGLLGLFGIRRKTDNAI